MMEAGGRGAAFLTPPGGRERGRGVPSVSHPCPPVSLGVPWPAASCPRPPRPPLTSCIVREGGGEAKMPEASLRPRPFFFPLF